MRLGCALSDPMAALCRSAATLVLFAHPCSAGLGSYTELDRVNGWLIERKQGADGSLSCRAFLPSGASWFSGNIHLDADGELVVGAASMALYDEVTPEMVLEGFIGDGPLVIDANFPETVLQAICKAQPQTRPVFAAATSVAKVGRLAGCLARLDALVLNRSEAVRIAGEAPVAGMACALAARLRPGGAVLVSDGDNQAALARGDDCVTASPPPLDLVRANGAGDAMAAALFWGLTATPDAGLSAYLEAALAAGADFAAGRQAEQN